MDNTKNALAELANGILNDLIVANAVAGFDQNVWNRIRKAQRIVAELAKVDDDQNCRPMVGSSISTICKCRAIAEKKLVMSSKNETVDDVIEYIRSLYCHDTVYECKTGWASDSFDEIADRLEAALKRERQAIKK